MGEKIIKEFYITLEDKKGTWREKVEADDFENHHSGLLHFYRLKIKDINENAEKITIALYNPKFILSITTNVD